MQYLRLVIAPRYITLTLAILLTFAFAWLAVRYQDQDILLVEPLLLFAGLSLLGFYDATRSGYHR